MLTLHNLKFSHYVEKARWALDYKGLPHVRVTLDADGRHTKVAQELTGGRCPTFPVLVLEDGEAVGESSEIVARLEELHPEPALYPADAGARTRVRGLEAQFDAELGPAVRIAAMDQMLADPELFVDALMPDFDPQQREAMLGYRDTMPAFVRKRFAIDESSLAQAYETFARIGERAHAELGEDGYFEGGRFGSADLALAAHVSPIVCPPEFPYAQPQRDHPLLERPRAALREAGILDWASRIYARHRGTSAEVRPSES